MTTIGKAIPAGLILAAAVVWGSSCRRSEMHQIEDQELRLTTVSRLAWVDTTEYLRSKAVQDSLVDYGSGIARSEKRPVSKMTEVEFQENDVIAVYIHEQSQLQAEWNHSDNMSYILQGGRWYATAPLSNALTASKYFASAYYPYKEGTTNTTKIAHSVSLDQSAPQGQTAGALEQSDFAFTLTPSEVRGLTGSTPSATFVFNHMMSKLQIDFEVPQVVDGEQISRVEEAWVVGMYTACEINLTNRVVTPEGTTDGKIKMRLKSGDRTPGKFSSFEAIVVPQTIAKGTPLVELRLTSVIGQQKKMLYIVPSDAGQVFAREEKVTLTLRSFDQLRFASELDLLDGMGKSGLPLNIVAPNGAQWTLSSPQPWCRLSLTAAGGYGAQILGTGTGSEQTIYVEVDPNITNEIAKKNSRTAVLTLSANLGNHTPIATYAAVQNFHAFKAPQGVGGTESNKRHATQVPSFISNQTWYAVSSDTTWLKLASAESWGAGTPGIRYPASSNVVGELASLGQMWMQFKPNPDKVARTTTVKYYAYYGIASSPKEVLTHTISQSPSSLTGSSATVGVDEDSKTTMTFTTTPYLDWSIIAKPSWVKDYTPKSGVVDATGKVTVTVTASVNPNNTSRSQAVTAKAGVMTVDMTLTQNNGALTVAPTSANVLAGIQQNSLFAVNTPVGAPWETVSNSPWLAITPATGTGAGTGAGASQKITVTTTAANNTNTDRTGTATVTTGNMSQVLTITQAAPVLSITTPTETVNPGITNSTFFVDIPANHQGVVWTPSAAISSGTSISVTPSGPQTVLDNAVYRAPVKITYNTNSAGMRIITGKATYGTSLYKEYAVRQEYAEFSLSASSINVSADATTAASPAVTYNVNWTASVSSPSGGTFSGATSGTAARTGLTVNPAVAGAWTFPAQPATPSVARTHTVSYTPAIAYSTYSVPRSYSVVQAAREPYISISPSSYSDLLPSTGGSYVATVYTNASWRVSSVDGCSVSPSSGVGTTQVTVSVSSHNSIWQQGRSANFQTYNHSGLSVRSASASCTQKDCPQIYLFFGKIELDGGRADIQTGFYIYPGYSTVDVYCYDANAKSWGTRRYAANSAHRVDLGKDGNVSSITVIDQSGKSHYLFSGTMNRRGFYSYSSSGSATYTPQSQISQ